MNARRATRGVIAAVAALAGTATPAPAVAQAPSDKVVLVSQSPWVSAGGELSLVLRVDRGEGPQRNLEIAVTVYEPVATRSEFALTVHDRVTQPSITTQATSLSSLAPDASGQVTVSVKVEDPSLPRDSSRLSLGREDGVYPVRVELRERGAGRVLDKFTTHLVYLPTTHTGTKLGMALVLPIHSPTGSSAKGLRPLEGIDDLASLVQTLDAVRGAPIALAPTAETLAGLASSADERSAAVLAGLRRVATELTVLNTSFVPVNLPSLRAAGLDSDAETQITRGPATVSEVLHVKPDNRMWLADEGLDQASLNELASRGVDRVVATDATLSTVPDQKLTITQPFRLGSKTGTTAEALSADAGLAAHLGDPVTPVLQANHLLADLAVLYLDKPGGDRRGTVALAPRTWQPSRQFVDTLMAGLNQSPILESVSLDQLFTSVPPATTGNGAPLLRTLASTPSPGLAEVAPDLRLARRRLDALGSILGSAAPMRAQLENRLLATESSELRSARQRQPLVDSVQKAIDSQLAQIEMPRGRSITLTARTGEIPVTFQNRTGSPARVVVKVQSDKLAFPRGTTQTIDLVRRNTTQRFAVESRTSGAFPMRITLESPDGNLVIGRTRLTVRSTAASGVSLLVSLGAAMFLAIWWGRHALRERRTPETEEK
ncbi:MAG TPA: DUF6049 family protein [Acidimicrobiales bacterium]|nr:DUF6049 family protein [Acidimicrobiales bacterium]